MLQASPTALERWKYRLTKSTNDADEFTGRRLLVTSATNCLGKTIADRFLQGDATVVNGLPAGYEAKNLICECYVRNCSD